MISAEKNPLFEKISYIFLLAVTALILVTYQHYGISWDEPYQREVGIRSLNYYLSGFKDLRAMESTYPDRIYGGFFEMIAESAVRINPVHPYETRHLITALAGLLGMIGCWRLTRLLGGSLAGLLSIIMLISFPTYMGHMFNNSKDIPFAAAYIWSVYYLILAFFGPGKPSSFCKFALTAGLTAGIRVGGLVLFPVAFLSWILFVYIRWRRADAGRLWDSVIAGYFLFLAFILAYALMLVFWPWALQSPISNVLSSLRSFSNWNGNQGDPWYIFRCFSIKLPESILFGLFGAALIFISKSKDIVLSFRRGKMGYSGKCSAFAILVLSFVVPALYIVAKKSVLYNEMRQIIFISLPILCCGAIVISYILRRLLMKACWYKYALAALILSLVALPAYSIFRLYPYHYIYCNNISGGLSGLGKEHTYEYYLHSYRALSFQLRQYLNRGNAWTIKGAPRKIFVHGSPQCFAYYLPSSVEIVDDPEHADFGVYGPLNYVDNRPSREIGAVSRCGLKLATLRAYGAE